MIVCDKCKKVMDYKRIENRHGHFVKLYECPKCGKLETQNPTKEEIECYD